jgi:prepilin-type N-terminal cleavage/methylation domain-containing protein
MNLKRHSIPAGFTLCEMLVALGVASVVFAAIITASVALYRSFNAVDDYFSTQMQQLRIMDYLNRDVKRATMVTTSANLQSITVTVPNYLIQAGDTEAVANVALIGLPRNPTVVRGPTGFQVNYGTGSTDVVYSVSNNSILRTEKLTGSPGPGQITTIASSTDQLLPQSTDVELANTEYASTTVTFMPIFTMNGSTAARTGTTLYTTSYLRNKRRG